MFFPGHVVTRGCRRTPSIFIADKNIATLIWFLTIYSYRRNSEVYKNLHCMLCLSQLVGIYVLHFDSNLKRRHVTSRSMSSSRLLGRNCLLHKMMKLSFN